MKEAERKLYEKGYYLSNQFDGFGTVTNEYELTDRNISAMIQAYIFDFKTFCAYSIELCIA